MAFVTNRFVKDQPITVTTGKYAGHKGVFVSYYRLPGWATVKLRGQDETTQLRVSEIITWT